MRPLRVLTWHIHGAYLYYLTHAHQEFYLPVKPGRPEGYGGRSSGYPWADNLHEVPAEQVKSLSLDAVLFQSRKNYETDQYEILSSEQQRLPRIYLEHDPPRESPTDTHHWVDDPEVLLVHVTNFNNLMWDSGRTPTRVIEHGVRVPDDARYTGEVERGITVVNNLQKRGRRLGRDVFDRARAEVPLDLIGIAGEELGGFPSLPHGELHRFEAPYRFFFNPIRYTSLGLAVCEAMMVGLPIVALATTEMATVVENGVTGYADTNVRILVERMRELMQDPLEARRLGDNARRLALERLSIDRFAYDWDQAFYSVAGESPDYALSLFNAATSELKE